MSEPDVSYTPSFMSLSDSFLAILKLFYFCREF